VQDLPGKEALVLEVDAYHRLIAEERGRHPAVRPVQPMFRRRPNSIGVPMSTVPTDRIASLGASRGNYLYGCGPYRGSCILTRCSKSFWHWKVWKVTPGFR
jgi:hypothetical protein